jgi:predicted sulfurtransferase
MHGSVWKSFLSALLVLVMGVVFVHAARGAEIPRMTKEQLQAMIDSPDLVVIDLRTEKDWKASEFKIKGAVREDPFAVDGWVEKYPKNKTVVLYCA